MLEIKNKENKENKKNKEEKITLSDIIITIVFGIIITLISFNFIRFSVVQGHSMDNTLYDGERLLLNTFIYDKNIPEYGDIVVIERTDLSVRFFIKRVIAVEGDTLSIKDNTVYLNGVALKEDYIKEDMFTEDIPEITIPKGKIFVMGDNRNNSLDSRSNVIGLIDVKDEILGKAIFSISTFSKINNK